VVLLLAALRRSLVAGGLLLILRRLSPVLPRDCPFSALFFPADFLHFSLFFHAFCTISARFLLLYFPRCVCLPQLIRWRKVRHFLDTSRP
jgi:hypothetical protein